MNIFDYGIDDMLFSCVLGSNVYCKEKISKTVYGEERIYVSHAIGNHKDLYYLRPIPNDCLIINSFTLFKNMVLDPPIKGSCVWPVDIVEFKESAEVPISRTNNKGTELKKCKYAFVFSDPGDVAVISLERYFRPDPQKLGYDCPQDFYWKSNEKLIFLLLTQMVILQKNGYSYPTLSDDNIFFTIKDGNPTEAMVDFNFFVFSQTFLSSKKVPIKESYLDWEYSDKYSYSDILCVDLYSESHSLAAILFRLSVGKLPYESFLLSAQNATPEEHIEWLSQYQKEENKRFVFCREDFDNYDDGLGLGGENDKYRSYWDGLTTNLKDMFINSLRRSNVLREKTETIRYTAEDWIRAFSKLFDWKID